ncbi:hypothetical protein [Wenzhouxiangella sp. EGI_FJ10409]|uniref:hypothetical protein n=1 Tax=Wenzhouxiangella sp. EGI_FJ10409 TaxID=3243767 RepID=UPI0035D87273
MILRRTILTIGLLLAVLSLPVHAQSQTTELFGQTWHIIGCNKLSGGLCEEQLENPLMPGDMIQVDRLSSGLVSFIIVDYDTQGSAQVHSLDGMLHNPQQSDEAQEIRVRFWDQPNGSSTGEWKELTIHSLSNDAESCESDLAQFWGSEPPEEILFSTCKNSSGHRVYWRVNTLGIGEPVEISGPPGDGHGTGSDEPQN